MELKNILLGCTLAFMTYTAQAQTQIIAHRGYWKTENSAQNSITGLKKAAEAKVYGSEFDVQLTGDGVIVVNHDDNVNGITIAEVPYSKLNGIERISCRRKEIKGYTDDTGNQASQDKRTGKGNFRESR